MSTFIRPSSLVSASAAALLLICSAQVFGSDFFLKPKLTVGEEYTDNVFDDRTNKADFITRVQPGLLLKYGAPLWDWNLDYAYDYRYYARGSRTQDTTQNINGSGLVKIIDEKLFLDLSDIYTRVSLNIARDTTHESLSVQQTDQNIGNFSPYLVLHPDARLTVKGGYRYINTWYKDPSAVSKQDHVGFFNGSYELSPKISLTADYSFTHEIPVKYISFNRQEAYLGPRFEYADKSFIFAKGGVISTAYANGNDVLNPSWSAGLTHTLDTMTANLNAGTSYSDDPLGGSILQTSYGGSLVKTLKRGSVTVTGSYAKLATEFSGANGIMQNNHTWSGGFSGAYELMLDLRGTLGFTYQNYHDLVADGTTNRYFVDSALNYDFGKELTASLYYNCSDYSSAKIVADNRRINRVGLTVMKVF